MYKPSVLARIWQDVQHWLASLGGGSASGGSGWTGPLVVILVVVALLGVVLYQTGPVSRAKLPRRGPVLQGRPMTADEHRAMAESRAAAGDFRSAIIERIRAIAADAEARQLVPPRPGRTAAELAAETSRVIPAESASLAQAARLFDDVRYGGRAGSQPGYAQVRDLDARIQAVPAAIGPEPAGALGQTSVTSAPRQDGAW
jgi:hypothetical protein